MHIEEEKLKEAILIRQVEEAFLSLFSSGKLNGTVHTCVGQEFSAIAFAGQLKKGDFVFSNHRCHGHFISFTKDYKGLIAELMGKRSGVCGGIGGSQHLCKDNFYSNGIQGGIMPVAAGLALSNKISDKKQVGVVYIGDGTLGEGIVYETMNILSKWKIPLLIVCENNLYAQSTHQSITLAGDILKRAEAFGIRTFHGNTQDPKDLIEDAQGSLDYVRSKQQPAFCLVDTYRLNSHSKSDDNRDETEIAQYRELDPLVVYERENPDQYEKLLNEVEGMIRAAVKEADSDVGLTLDDYYKPCAVSDELKWTEVEQTGTRQIDLINGFLDRCLNENKKSLILGEDIMSPYGGAFKVTKGLSGKYPDQVFATPISEGAIVGISNGLALGGMRPIAELMFGDFITLAMDQIINHASKFYHMYNKQAKCPVIIRTPMGGRRGYGPTHSQTLDKFITGIDNVTVIAINSLIDPGLIYDSVVTQEHPVIVLENKVDYGRKVGPPKIQKYKTERSSEAFPCCRIRPVSSKPTLTLVTYGGAAMPAIESIESLLLELDFKAEVIVLSCIHPIDYRPIIESVKATRSLFVIEEGSAFGGLGSEIIASVTEVMEDKFVAGRIASLPVPVPSNKDLEDEVLPNSRLIVNYISRHMEGIST